jgi:hypothetical protein
MAQRPINPEEFKDLVSKLRETGWDTDAPMRWSYRFDAWDRSELEKLVPKLQALGYLNPRIDGSEASCFSLIVEVIEPISLDRMNAQPLADSVCRDGEGEPWYRGCSMESYDSP